METINALIRFMQEGGAYMYVIALVMLVGLGIGGERWLYLQRAKINNRKAWDAIFPHLRKGDLKQAVAAANESKSGVGNMISFGLSTMLSAQGMVDRRHLPAVEQAMEESLMETTPLMEKRTPYIALLANVATLFGLLGTIIGLIDAFAAVAAADPSEKGAMLSKSIAVAMNTTALGLVAAIPLMMIHAFLSAKTNEVVDSLDMAGVKVVNLLRHADNSNSDD